LPVSRQDASPSALHLVLVKGGLLTRRSRQPARAVFPLALAPAGKGSYIIVGIAGLAGVVAIDYFSDWLFARGRHGPLCAGRGD